MGKKLITACMALFALAAFALPASASAAGPVVTHPTGTRLDPEAGECTTVKKTVCVTAHNVGETILFNGAGTEELTKCTSAIMTGYLTKNTGGATGTVEGTIHTATFSGTGGAHSGMNECTGVAGSFGNLTVTTNGGGVDENTVASGTPYCLKANNTMAANEFQVRGGKCSEAARAITFNFDTTLAGECKYSRAAAEPIKGTYTTHTTGDAILSVSPAVPANTKFTAEAGNSILCPASTTLKLSLTLVTETETAEPLFISQ
jgi:hypothetical protein